MKQKSRKGFTMVELIVMVGLVAIIGAIGTNHFLGVFEANREAAILADAERLVGALNSFNSVAANNVYPGDSRVIGFEGSIANQDQPWGFSDTRFRGLKRSGGSGFERRNIICNAADECIVGEDACDDTHLIQLVHYVNHWRSDINLFESTGIMQADFSLSIDCEHLVEIISRPLIGVNDGRWFVLEP